MQAGTDTAPGMTPATGVLASGPLDAGRAKEAAGKVVKIDLPHMNVVLSLSVEPAGGAAAGKACRLPAGFDADASDPAVRRLFRQLDRPRTDGDADGVHSDAVRLALVALWLGTRAGRCEPERDAPVRPLQKWRMKRVEAFVEEHIDEAIPLAALAGAAGLSRMYFAAQFRAATGMRPHDYLLRRRIERSKQLLADPDGRLVEIALDVGFQTQAHFTAVFKRFVGTTPARWRAANCREREQSEAARQP